MGQWVNDPIVQAGMVLCIVTLSCWAFACIVLASRMNLAAKALRAGDRLGALRLLGDS